MDAADFLADLNLAQRAIAGRLALRRAGAPGVGTVSQLQPMQRELAQVAELVANGKAPPPEERWLEAAQTAIDSWPLSDELNDHLCRLNYIYRHMLP
jgi:hypothetical protein